MGPQLRLVDAGTPVPAELDAEAEFAWVTAPPSLRARIAAAEAERARAGTPIGRARVRAAEWLCTAGAGAHAGCRALAERVAP
jgi:hypothetical protein